MSLRPVIAFLGLLGVASALNGCCYTNWARSQVTDFLSFTQPRTENEIVDTVRRAFRNGETVSVVGAGHSWSGIAVNQGHLMNLDNFDKIITVQNNVAFVQAGIRAKDLFVELDKLGYAVNNTGAIAEQSISGIFQTNTHGTGITGGLSTFIEQVRLITGNGTVIVVSETRNADLWNAVRLGIGVQGIMSVIGIRVVPQFKLRRDIIRFDRMSNLLNNLPKLHEEHERFEFFVIRNNSDQTNFPNCRLAECEVIVKTYTVTDQPIRPPRTGCRDIDQFLPCVDKSYRVTSAPGSPPASEPTVYHEVFSPVEKEMDFIRDWLPLEPFVPGVIDFVQHQYRFVKADDILLSPFNGQDVIITDIFAQSAALAPVERYVERWSQYARSRNNRMHWGKATTFTREDWERVYPDTYDKFIDAREKIDPTGVFLNDLTRDLFTRRE